MSYHSPIVLHHCCSIDIEKPISIKGENTGSQYDSQKHIYKVQNKIILRANGRKYRLEEYHFHIPCEHVLNNTIYPAEIHYVFYEIGDYQPHDSSDPHKYHSCCDDSGEKNILVIGRVISSLKSHQREPVDLSRFPIDIPNCYYEYDGSLTTGNFAPVRWLVGNDPLRIDIEQLLHVSKPARPVQDLNGRIILYST